MRAADEEHSIESNRNFVTYDSERGGRWYKLKCGNEISLLSMEPTWTQQSYNPNRNWKIIFRPDEPPIFLKHRSSQELSIAGPIEAKSTPERAYMFGENWRFLLRRSSFRRRNVLRASRPG